MATGNLVKDFSDEATCSLCLEHFKDPVTVDCGHNFCQACITQCLGKVEAEPSCPQCRETISQRNFRPNRQLANLVELIKKLQREKQEEEKRGVCREHQEPLKFFCKDDRMCICALCYQFKGHKGHNVFYLEEASEEFKEKIKNQIPSLVKKRKELEALNSDEEQKMQKSLAHLEKEKEKIMSAFEELQTVLELNRCAWLSLLEDLEEKVKEIREENSAELLSEVTSLNSQIAEIEKKCQQPADELLQDIADGLDVYDSAEARKPVLKPWTLEANLRLWTQRREALETIVQDSKDSLEKSLLRGSLEASLEKVIVTLDPDTAHPFLFVSEDRSSVTRGDSSQILPFKRERFDIMPCVLGCEKFTTGRHYWHVEIEGNGATWTIGVARESVKRKDRINFGPEEGIWAIQSHFCPGFSHQTGYQVSALTSPSQIIISPSWQLSKIRVSLDYEEGCVAFFDACSGRSIFTFSSASFARERVCPFFRLSPGTTLNCC